MFCFKHRSVKVTLFSKIHIKIISKISLTYHQIALSIDFTFMHGAILLLLCSNKLIIVRDRRKSDSSFSIFPICPYFDAEQHIAIAIKITITTPRL